MSAIYFMGQKYTGPTLNLGSGSLTTDNKTIVGAINELNDGVNEAKPLFKEIASFSSFPQTVNDARITSTMRVTAIYLGTPYAVTSAIDWVISSGSVTITGTIDGSTTAVLKLEEPME